MSLKRRKHSRGPGSRKHNAKLRLGGILIGGLCFSGLALLSLFGYFYSFLRPQVVERSEIYQGIFYESGNWPDQTTGSGRYMVVEIHLDEPGVEIFIRPFIKRPSDDSHYTVLPADYLVRSFGADVLINSTLYSPNSWYNSLPGMRVTSGETVVYKGSVSHVDEKSYLLWFDRDMNSHLEIEKPPSPEVLSKAFWGVGLQGYLINAGAINWNSIQGSTMPLTSTFIGINPSERVLWLMAFEDIVPGALGEFAREKGVEYGGMMDDEATMLIGKNPFGIRSYTGIRGKRPLGAFIGVRANKILGD
jgi:hypothetical protein